MQIRPNLGYGTNLDPKKLYGSGGYSTQHLRKVIIGLLHALCKHSHLICEALNNFKNLIIILRNPNAWIPWHPYRRRRRRRRRRLRTRTWTAGKRCTASPWSWSRRVGSPASSSPPAQTRLRWVHGQTALVLPIYVHSVYRDGVMEYTHVCRRFL